MGTVLSDISDHLPAVHMLNSSIFDKTEIYMTVR